MYALVALAQQVAKLILGLSLAFASSTALGASIELRGDLKQLSADQVPEPASAAGALAPSDFTWLALAKRNRLDQLPAGWELTVDQVRFSKIAIIAFTKDGKVWSLI